MDNLQRVNLLLERRQREALERLAHQKGRSVSDLVRTYVARGLEQESSPQAERKQALESARVLKERILKRRGHKTITDSVEALDRMREERANELLGH